MKPSDAVEQRIREEAAKLETFHNRIIRCRVVVEIPHSRHRRGKAFHIGIYLTVPGGEIAVKHEPSLHRTMRQTDIEETEKVLEVQGPHKDIYVSIRDAFMEARRRLQDYDRQQNGLVKARAPQPTGFVCKLFPDEGYGFLDTGDGHEVYFHKNSVLHDDYGHLKIGTEVAFAEGSAEKGPTASTVRLLRGHRHHKIGAPAEDQE